MWGMTGGVTYNDIADFCDNIPEDDNTIDVYLHCNGGSVIEGWAMYDRLRKGDYVHCGRQGRINGHYLTYGRTEGEAQGV